MNNQCDTGTSEQRKNLIRYINLKLAAMGHPIYIDKGFFKDDPIFETEFINLSENLILDYQEKQRLLKDYLPPVDQRIQNFLNRYFQDIELDNSLKVPNQTFILDQKGIASEISLPPDKNEFINEYVSSYRIMQGVLHNPIHDRRTTEGSFHIVKGGFPVSHDKKEVSKVAFAHLFQAAINPPNELKKLPFTTGQKKEAKVMLSILIRPIVVPEVKGVSPEKTMEIRYFCPGSLVSNLDFIERIFGNGGDPTLWKNDAAIDVEHWSGHTGCIILAPHLIKLKKKDIGLPHWDDASERQKRDGMCWRDSEELYNGGNPFKLTCRDDSGIVITLIADNYYGYSKKEIKTQISYAANSYGLAEEEHAGGALAFPRKNIGERFSGAGFLRKFSKNYSFEEVKRDFSNLMDIQSENYGIDKNYKNIIYIPELTEIDLYKSELSWDYNGETKKLKLLPNHFYIHPTGFKLHMEKHPAAPSWRIVSTYPEGVFCHKPSTVSGGGKSEISKSLLNAIIYGSFYIDDMKSDFEVADKIINFDYSKRWKEHPKREIASIRLLSRDRTLGSVIKLLTPSPFYTDEYNSYLDDIPIHVKALVLFIKRFYREEDSVKHWRDYFSVDIINGREGHALLFNGRKIVASYLRVGFASETFWYVHKLRSDFIAAEKIQMEDDVTASITVPLTWLPNLSKEYYKSCSVKLTSNCERYLFQRPDEAIHKGYDKQAEADLAQEGNFTTNYEPLTPKHGRDLIEDAIEFDKYTTPIQELIKIGANGDDSSYFVTPSHPRLVNGEASKNPRYLQKRPDLVYSIGTYLAEIGLRFHRKIPLDRAIYFPVDSILMGRRNNRPDKKKGIKGLSVYNPIHYQDYPELFMDLITSLTGKSPSTTGFGSEGALTKGPFNMLPYITDLNNALLSYILTGQKVFSSAAGYIGTETRVDHDISILIPELWCRLTDEQRDINNLIKEGSFEKMEDFKHNGVLIPASRLGYRITQSFLFRYMGTVFDEPQAVFPENVLKPELQDMEAFVEGILYIADSQKTVSSMYFKDGSVDGAIPPLKALLHIMALGNYNGKTEKDKEIRDMFTLEYILSSGWYQERLKNRQNYEIKFWGERIDYIKSKLNQKNSLEISIKLNIEDRLKYAQKQLETVSNTSYLQYLKGTIGLDPIYRG